MSDDILARFSELQDAIGGCTDGYCVIRRNRGQHTNGGCRCLDYMDHTGRQRVGHMLRVAQDMVSEITRLREQLAEAERQRDAARAEALEEAVVAVRAGRWKNRDWVPGSLWDKLRAEMERDIRALIKEDRK